MAWLRKKRDRGIKKLLPAGLKNQLFALVAEETLNKKKIIEFVDSLYPEVKDSSELIEGFLDTAVYTAINLDEEHKKVTIKFIKLISIGNIEYLKAVISAGRAYGIRTGIYRKVLGESGEIVRIHDQHKKKLEKLGIPTTRENILTSYLAEQSGIPLERFKLKNKRLV